MRSSDAPLAGVVFDLDGKIISEKTVTGLQRMNNIDVEYARSKGIQVFNTAEASAVAVAELAFALMISVPTRLVEGHVSLKDGEWRKKELKRTELMGKTL